MGLDNFWELPEGVPHPNFDPPLNLWGGLFSDHGCQSFRGKMYSTFCDMVMGINLYNDVISNQELLTATERLRVWIEENPDSRLISDEEVNDLYRMFNTYANLGATLESWS